MKRQWIAAGCVAVLCNGSAWAFDFGTPEVHPTGSWASVAAIGDLNGDQLDDIVLGTTYYFDPDNDGRLFVYLQRPDGSLSMPLLYPYTADINQGPLDIVLGDVNRDGVLDVATCSPTGVSILRRNGADFAVSPVSSAACASIALIDVDLDGNLDVVAYYDNKATMYYGDGRGTFPRTDSFSVDPTAGGRLLVGDLTGDGVADLVVTGYNVVVYPHAASGGFLPAVSYSNATGAWGVGGAAIGDFNGDGRGDIAVSESANSPDAAIWIYSQTSAGTLSAPLRLSSYDIPAAMVAQDLDHDGLTDLLVGHDGWAALGRYMQDAAGGLAAEVRSPIAYNESGRALATGDINDDGCTDAVVAEHNAGLQTLLGSGCVPGHARADFNGDGVSDAVWRNTSTGANAIWQSADPNPRIALPAVSLGWRIAGIGDFDGDGKADLLWHQDGDGSSVVWYAGDASTATVLPRVNTSWAIVGVGDVNGDGKDDLVWRHANGNDAVWLSANASTGLAVRAVTDVHWKIVGVDDLDGDGKADLLWRNDATGADVVWPAADWARRRNLVGVTDLHWIVGGTGDFDGDGKADILWHQTATGANAIWRSGDATTPMRIATGGASWQVVVGDYTGDRKADLLWRNPANGVNVIWRAAQMTVSRDVTDVTVTAWRLVP